MAGVLVVIHVLSAVLGLGPAYAFPFILKGASTVEEMRRNVRHVARLEMFPKLFGSIAVVSGLVLFFAGSYGPFVQVWILGSLAVYVAIEILVIGFLNPAAGKLTRLLNAPEAAVMIEPDAPMNGLYARVRHLHLWAGVQGLLIFILMIAKPH